MLQPKDIDSAEYLVPCSTQSQCPYLWSAALRCTHGMAILGDPGVDEWEFPAAVATPESATGNPSPSPP